MGLGVPPPPPSVLGIMSFTSLVCSMSWVQARRLSLRVITEGSLGVTPILLQ